MIRSKSDAWIQTASGKQFYSLEPHADDSERTGATTGARRAGKGAAGRNDPAVGFCLCD